MVGVVYPYEALSKQLEGLFMKFFEGISPNEELIEEDARLLHIQLRKYQPKELVEVVIICCHRIYLLYLPQFSQLIEQFRLYLEYILKQNLPSLNFGL